NEAEILIACCFRSRANFFLISGKCDATFPPADGIGVSPKASKRVCRLIHNLLHHMHSHHILTAIEPLESRIAPALATATFTDVDGDLVIVISTKGTSAQLHDALVLSNPNDPANSPHQLQALNLGAPFANAVINITASPKTDPNTQQQIGNGLVNVGSINASSIDLRAVFVGGDLGKIVVGNNNPRFPG